MQRRITQRVISSLAISGLVLGTTLGFAPMAMAGGEANGDGFRETAQEYEELADESLDNGDSGTAAIYNRLAEIKYEAAALADEGRWDDIDWTEYHELQGDLYEDKKH
jgi:hypothetical protein